LLPMSGGPHFIAASHVAAAREPDAVEPPGTHLAWHPGTGVPRAAPHTPLERVAERLSVFGNSEKKFGAPARMPTRRCVRPAPSNLTAPHTDSEPLPSLPSGRECSDTREPARQRRQPVCFSLKL